MTQEYTPVAWQDETTSQQGTLINAERLNQMQQAHHYADGLEEVDAVPTANPGVSYHKIVYCTADSTIYRWDGTEWTADIDDETKRLLEQEIARATEAEGVLRQGLADEATARETADTAMQADISALGDAIEAEETARGQADTALGTRITNETSARETADTGLGNRITAEATARADADTALGGRIDTEQARAEAAEQANAQAIANTYTKAEIDTALGAKADVATTYSKTETDALLALKANDNAVVHLAGAETIPGAKTFTAVTNMFAINYERTGGYLEQCKIPTEERGTVPSSQVQVQPLTINDKDGQQLYFEQYITGTDGARRYRKNIYTTQGTRVQIEDLWVNSDGTGWRGSPTLPDDAPPNALTTINWVSQTGDAAPNNLAHRLGNETWDGVKRIAGNIGKMSTAYKTSAQTETWFKMLEGARVTYGRFATVLIMDTNNNNAAIIKLGGYGTTTNYWCGPITKNSFPMANVRFTIDTENNMALWVKPRLSSTPIFVAVLLEGQSLVTGAFNPWLTAMGEPNTPEAEPVVGSTYTVVYTPSDVTS